MADTEADNQPTVGEEESVEAMFAAKKKKKKSKKVEDAAGGADAAASEAPGAGSSVAAPVSTLDEGETEETYDEMLGKIFHLLHENNPELIGREKKRLKPPQVSRVGSTRSAWTNFKDICVSLKRSPEHILSFYLAELGTTGAIDGSDRLMLKGKFQPKYIESLLRKYITEYVQCHMCRNTETELTRDPISRLYFMNCKACGSSRSVVPIKAGFHATSKGERKKAREALG